MAASTGLSIESVSNIKHGIFGPKFDNLEKISETLKVPVRELFQFPEENN
ncbi:MAG: helix-turn-helix transcriptional regulator [Gammaproteobacteria bacterium]|nr:helix-turn-helix transcriptional regulator [Gammaproteobacteria bacterium]